jgi:ABC-type nitrate/sulfonate/bicarbonate transport system ATPase subunit
MVFQNYALFPHLTVRGHVAFPLEMRNVARAEIERRVGEALALVELAGYEARLPRQLSGGQQQRVALARAIVFNPRLLLLDEPFGALDAITREQLQREIAVILAQSPKTVVFITHNMDEAIFFSDRILVMGSRPGRILDEVRVDLPRPREADAVRASREFATMREHLWSLLSEGGKAA